AARRDRDVRASIRLGSGATTLRHSIFQRPAWLPGPRFGLRVPWPRPGILSAAVPRRAGAGRLAPRGDVEQVGAPGDRLTALRRPCTRARGMGSGRSQDVAASDEGILVRGARALTTPALLGASIVAWVALWTSGLPTLAASLGASVVMVSGVLLL